MWIAGEDLSKVGKNEKQTNLFPNFFHHNTKKAQVVRTLCLIYKMLWHHFPGLEITKQIGFWESDVTICDVQILFVSLSVEQTRRYSTSTNLRELIHFID
jgi:hypothetical protein